MKASGLSSAWERWFGEGLRSSSLHLIAFTLQQQRWKQLPMTWSPSLSLVRGEVFSPGTGRADGFPRGVLNDGDDPFSHRQRFSLRTRERSWVRKGKLPVWEDRTKVLHL